MKPKYEPMGIGEMLCYFMIGVLAWTAGGLLAGSDDRVTRFLGLALKFAGLAEMILIWINALLRLLISRIESRQ
jgi:hypothetical protein